MEQIREIAYNQGMPIPPKVDLAQFCKEVREELGCTQEEMAARLNVTGRAISYWETGKRTPNGEIVLQMITLRDQFRSKKLKQ